MVVEAWRRRSGVAALGWVVPHYVAAKARLRGDAEGGAVGVLAYYLIRNSDLREIKICGLGARK